MIDQVKNHNVWKGKTHIEMFGKERAEEIRKILSESKMGDKNPAKRKEVKDKISSTFKKKADNGWVNSAKGTHYGAPRIQQMRETTKKLWEDSEFRTKMNSIQPQKSSKMIKWHKDNKEKIIQNLNKPETKEKMRVSHIKAMADGKYSNKKDTDIERFIEALLIKNGWVENIHYFKQYPFPKDKPRYLLDF